MEYAKPPANLVLQGGAAQQVAAWCKWRDQFLVFLKASGSHKEKKDVQASLLINLMGSDGYDVYSKLKCTDEEQADIDLLIKKLNTHFGMKQTAVVTRYEFFTRDQGVEESIETYLTELKLLSRHCKFDHLEEEMLRDRIVCGIADNDLRDTLLRVEDLTLDKAVQICQIYEESASQSAQADGRRGRRTGKGHWGKSNQNSRFRGYANRKAHRANQNGWGYKQQVPWHDNSIGRDYKRSDPKIGSSMSQKTRVYTNKNQIDSDSESDDFEVRIVSQLYTNKNLKANSTRESRYSNAAAGTASPRGYVKGNRGLSRYRSKQSNGQRDHDCSSDDGWGYNPLLANITGQNERSNETLRDSDDDDYYKDLDLPSPPSGVCSMCFQTGNNICEILSKTPPRD